MKMRKGDKNETLPNVERKKKDKTEQVVQRLFCALKIRLNTFHTK